MPSLFLFVFIAASFFTESASYLPTLIFGTYMGWIYLRYFQRKPETNLRGDPSDEFAFSNFFPELLRQYALACSICFHPKESGDIIIFIIFHIEGDSWHYRPVLDPIASIFELIFCRRSKISNETKGHTLGATPLPISDPIEISRRRYISYYIELAPLKKICAILGMHAHVVLELICYRVPLS